MIEITKEPALELTTQDTYFLNLIENRITMYGQIPYTVPRKLIIEIIKESARLFFRYSWNTKEKAYYRLTLENIKNFLSKDNPNLDYSNLMGYEVKLPSYIFVVEDIYETNKNVKASSNELIENVQSLNRIAPFGQSLMGINNNLYITEAACKMIEEQAFDSIFGTSVGFSYSHLTNKLRIKTVHKNNLILSCLCNVDVQQLYNDDLFLRHVLASTKRELKRVLAGHIFNLPGGVTVSAEEICNNIEDADKVEDIIKASSGVGDIILVR